MFITSISDLTPDQRFQQVAVILARGVMRYKQRVRRSESIPASENDESSQKSLELWANQRLSGSRRCGILRTETHERTQ
jgi:hypothetical protein